jgi:D-lactate dehydrogenase (cytochrome)
MGAPISAATIIDRLTEMVGPRASVAPGVLNDHGRSEAYHASCPPDVVVFPDSTEEVAQIVKLCADLNMPIVPFGAGTSLEGNAAAEDRTRMWHARDNTLYAGLSLKPGARAVITDVCVPISRLAECLVETRRDVDENNLIAPVVGHVGDGNFHMLILIDPANSEEVARAKALHARMVARAIAMEGTCTGEHGVGLGKIGFLRDELGETVDVMRSIKAALDPGGLMNPGKIFLPASSEVRI